MLMEIFLLCLFLLCLGCHIYTDIKEMLLYDVVSFVLLIGGCLYSYLYGSLWDSLWGAIAAGGAMLMLYYLSHGGMGEGDVKLAFVLGVWLGPWSGLVCLLLAFMGGGLVGCVLLLGRRYGCNDKLPFGPYLCMGGAIALFYGHSLLSWYLSYF